MSGEEGGGSAGTDSSIIDRFTSFARTRKGSVLLAESVTCLIVFICFCAALYGGYPTAPIVEMVLSVIFFIIYMNKFNKSISFIHWPWTDFIRCAIAVVILLIISIIAIVSQLPAQIAGGAFGLLAAGLFAYDAYMIFPSLKGNKHDSVAVNPPDYTP